MRCRRAAAGRFDCCKFLAAGVIGRSCSSCSSGGVLATLMFTVCCHVTTPRDSLRHRGRDVIQSQQSPAAWSVGRPPPPRRTGNDVVPKIRCGHDQRCWTDAREKMVGLIYRQKPATGKQSGEDF